MGAVHIRFTNEPVRLTPWFRWPIHPVREGWYDFRGVNLTGIHRMYWNGWQFGYWLRSDWIHVAGDSSDEWRGMQR